jgi:chromosome segregation ATPase
VSNPGTIIDAIHGDAADLDRLSKALHEATEALDAAEEAWDVLFDATAESLKDDLVQAGSTRDPAEHTITSVARRQHRAEYQALRRAKRRLEKLERQLQAKRAALNGRQSELAALRAEAHAADMPQPQWSRSAA